MEAIKIEALVRMILNNETKQILHNLHSHRIEPLLYKGILFNEKIYEDKYVREIGDLDLVFKVEDVEKALELLWDNGYFIRDKELLLKNERKALIENMLNSKDITEVPVVKRLPHIDSVIDFHWAFNFSFLPYNVNLDYMFSNQDNITIANNIYPCPNIYGILTMIVIHHGGRDCWTSLKYMADLLAFMKKHENTLDWTKALSILKEQKLKRPFLMGLFLLKKYFYRSFIDKLEIEISEANFKEQRKLFMNFGIIIMT